MMRRRMMKKRVDICADELPKEIMDAARVLEQWAAKNSYRYWAIGGVCDRKFESIVKIAIISGQIKCTDTYRALFGV